MPDESSGQAHGSCAPRVLRTLHGDVDLPVFLPDATRAVLKGLGAADIRACGVRALAIFTSIGAIGRSPTSQMWACVGVMNGVASSMDKSAAANRASQVARSARLGQDSTRPRPRISSTRSPNASRCPSRVYWRMLSSFTCRIMRPSGRITRASSLRKCSMSVIQ